MKVLITGGLGFIGANIGNHLKDKHDVIILDGFTKDYPGYAKIYRGKKDGVQNITSLERNHRDVNWAVRDLMIEEIPVIHKFSYDWLDTEQEFDLIINCGGLSEAILGEQPEFYELCHVSIVKGLLQLKNLFPNVPMIHFSSSMVYGEWENYISEDAELNPLSRYGAEKYTAETLLNPEKDIILRPMHVFGSGDGKFPIFMSIDRAVQNNKPLMVEEADCTYVPDLVDIIDKMVNNFIPGIYNISSGFKRDASIIRKIVENKFQIKIITKEKLGPTGQPRGMLDISKLKNTYSWESSYINYQSAFIDYCCRYKTYANRS